MTSNLQDMVHRLIEAGLTQKEIGERVGCSQPTISDIAQGKIGKKRPSYSLVIGLEKLISETANHREVEAGNAAA